MRLHASLRPLLVSLALLALAGSLRAAHAQPAGPGARGDTLASRVDSVFAAYTSRESPGCAVAAMRDGQIALERGYGMANLEHDVPITPASIFHVASISKQFTAMSILLLEKDGKLSLDDPVRRYVPEVPDFGTPVTIRHLIHHTSGLRDQWALLGLAGWRPDDPKSEADILELVSRQTALNFPPGSEYLYSNTGYTLLGTIVKRVSGKSLREFADERIFRPLGMTSTHFHDDHTMIVKGRTSAYEPRREGGGYRVSLPVFDNAGATSLFTTVRDLAQWDRNFDSATVGGRDMLARMETRGRLTNGDTLPYAFALTIGRYRGLRTMGHNGADAGYRADFLRFPDHHFAVATLCNVSTANPSALGRKVADIFLGAEMAKLERAMSAVNPAAPKPAAAAAVTIAAAELARYAGAYIDTKTETLRRFLVRDGKLAVSAGGPATPLTPRRAGVFAMTGQPVTFHFHAAANGSGPARMEERVEGARPVIYEPVPPASALAPTALAAYAGAFRSEELGVEWTVAVRDTQLVLRRRKFEEQSLQPAFADAFISPQLGLVRFTRGDGGRITGFTLSAGRVRRMRFERAGA
ncbi:MAG: serine hydrolase domain-containing protein [Gemmatimonadaceae bacterium]